MFYKFNIVFLLSYLNYKVMIINSLSSSSTVQHIISNSFTYVHKQFEFISIAFTTLVNAYFGKIITTDSPKSHNPVKNMYFIQILSIVLAILAYYAGIMLNAFVFLLCSKLCWHNRLKSTEILWLYHRHEQNIVITQSPRLSVNNNDIL